MFKIKKFNQLDSSSIILSLLGFMRLGNSLYNSLLLQEEIETGKSKKFLGEVNVMAKKPKAEIPNLLLQYDIIDESERLILLKSKDTKESLEYIIKMRSLAKNYDKTVISLLFFPIIAMYLGLGIVKFVLPTISAPIFDLIKVAEIKKGVNLEETLNIHPAFFYIHHPEYIDYIAIGFTILLAILFGLFKHLEKNNPTVLYKVSPLKSFDDIPYIFILMRALNKGGMDIYSIADTLYKSNLNRGWKIFFLRIKNSINANKKIYTVFDNFGFPKKLSVVIKASEASKSFWDNFDNMIEFAITTNIDKNNEILRRYKGLANMLGYTIVIYFILGILLLSMSMQNIITAMQ